MTDVVKCEINVTVGNGQKMKCELKGSVKMKLQDQQMAKLIKVLYVIQAVEKLFSVPRLVSKGATMRSTKDKIIIKKNGVGMQLDARNGKKRA